MRHQLTASAASKGSNLGRIRRKISVNMSEVLWLCIKAGV